MTLEEDTNPGVKPPSLSPLATVADVTHAVNQMGLMVGEIVGRVGTANATVDRIGQTVADHIADEKYWQTQVLEEQRQARAERTKDRKSKNFQTAALSFAAAVIASTIGVIGTMNQSEARAAAADVAEQRCAKHDKSTEAISYEAARRGARDEHAAMLREANPKPIGKP